MDKIKSIGIPIKFSKTPLSIREAAPLLGQHTTAKLQEIGLSEEEIQALYEEGIIYQKYADLVEEEA